MAAESHSFFASSAFATTSATVSPQVIQPGSSGYEAIKPDSSVSGIMSKMTASSF